MEQTLTVVEAKTRFSECLRRVEAGSSIVITRHGKPVAAFVAATELAKLRALRAAGPEAGLAGLAGGWEGSEELAEILGDSRRTGPREVPDLD